jgi:hypothetical protein
MTAAKSRTDIRNFLVVPKASSMVVTARNRIPTTRAPTISVRRNVSIRLSFLDSRARTRRMRQASRFTLGDETSVVNTTVDHLGAMMRDGTLPLVGAGKTYRRVRLSVVPPYMAGRGTRR